VCALVLVLLLLLLLLLVLAAAGFREHLGIGAITWQAHPHNAQYELYDTALLEFSFDMTHDLDRRFGLRHKHTATLVRQNQQQRQPVHSHGAAAQ